MVNVIDTTMDSLRLLGNPRTLREARAGFWRLARKGGSRVRLQEISGAYDEVKDIFASSLDEAVALAFSSSTSRSASTSGTSSSSGGSASASSSGGSTTANVHHREPMTATSSASTGTSEDIDDFDELNEEAMTDEQFRFWLLRSTATRSATASTSTTERSSTERGIASRSTERSSSNPVKRRRVEESFSDSFYRSAELVFDVDE